MKSWRLWVSIAAVIIVGFLLLQDTLARLAWQKYHLAPVASLLNRRDAKLAFDLGNYYFGGGEYDLALAEEEYKRAGVLDTQLLGPRYQLSRVAFLQGDFSKARSLINEEISLHPDFKRSFYVRGLIEGYAGNSPQAENDFKKFLEWDSQSWAAHNDLAWIYFQKGEYEKAKVVAEEGLKFNPQNPWLLNALGVALLNMNKMGDAKAAFQKALSASRRLSSQDFKKAYPGHDPGGADLRLSSFVEILENNLKKAMDK